MRHKLVLVLALFVPNVAIGEQAPNSVAALASVPDVDIQVTPERDSVHRGEPIPVVVVVTNRSQFPLRHFKLTLLPNDGQFKNTPALPETISELSIAHGSLEITPQDTVKRDVADSAIRPAEFGKHKLTLLCECTWSNGAKELSSGKPVQVELQINRQFEEEAKALPGGSAAILYMILPIVTAFIGYGLIESLRLGKGLQIPEFKAAHVAVAFLLSIALNFLMRAVIHYDESFIYADPAVFLLTLLAFAMAGASIPAIRWLYHALLWHWRAFPEDPSYLDYVSRVLRSNPNGEIDWVKIEFAGEDWEGIYLTQPDETVVLGQRLQISVKDAKDAENLTSVIDQQGKVLNTRALLNLIKAGRVDLGAVEVILHAGNAQDQGKKVVALNAGNVTVKSRLRKSFLTQVG